jgi:hypothetical protein
VGAPIVSRLFSGRALEVEAAASTQKDPQRGHREIMNAPKKITGLSLEWTGHHHSQLGDFEDLTTHTVTYETDSACYVTSNNKLVGEAEYIYQRLDDQIGICIYKPKLWQGRTDVVLRAIFDFQEMTDRAVITASEKPFAVAIGRISVVPTPDIQGKDQTGG